jgi:hypothetical protein
MGENTYLLFSPVLLSFPKFQKRRVFMKRIMMVIGLVLLIASFALAGAPKNYQVTGPGLEFDGDHITVLKGKDEKHEIAFDKDVKVTGGEIKKGAKVTVMYKMIAVSVEVKEPAKAEKPAKEAPKKK